MTNSSSGQGGRGARVSVNLDIANLPAEAAATILKEAVNYGRVVTARAFSDFRRNDLGDLPVQLFQLGFQLIHCPSWPNGGGRLKSVVDSILAQDLRDQAENDPDLDVFILGSGDRDFLAVVHALRRHGRKVIIASTADASNRSLLATADGYIQIQAPERHSFHVPSAQMYAPQPPAAVYSGPVTSLPPAAYAPPPAAPAPSRHTAPHLVAPRQRHSERGVRNAAPAVVAPAPAPALAAPPVAPAPAAPVVPARSAAVTAPPAVHPMQPQRTAAPFGRAARQAAAAPQRAPVAAAPAAIPAPEPEPVAVAPATPAAYPHLTAATLHDQIVNLVLSQPQITPRQVLQALAPRAEAGSARRRQAIGDAIAQLLQQGRLTRRTEVVRGRPADVLYVNGAAPAESEALEVPFAPELDEEFEVTPLTPAPARREGGRSRFGDRRAGRGERTAAFRQPEPEPDVDLALDFAAADLESAAEVPAGYPDETLDVPAVWEPEPEPAPAAVAAEAAVTAEPEAAATPEPEAVAEPAATPERSTLVGRRAAPAPRPAATAAEPVRPARRFRAPVFTHTPEVIEAATAAEHQAAPAASAPPAELVQQEPEAATVAPAAAAPAAFEAVAPVTPEPETSVAAEAATETVDGTVAEGAAEEAATAAPRPRRRRTRTRSANGKGEAQGEGESSGAEGESAAVAAQ